MVIQQASQTEQQKNNNGLSQLMIASDKGDFSTVKRLLKNGALVEQRDNNGDSALDFAIKKGFYSITKILVQAGASASATYGVAYTKNIEITKDLLASGSGLKFHLYFLAPYLANPTLANAESIYASWAGPKYEQRQYDEINLYRINPIKYILDYHYNPKTALQAMNNLEASGYKNDFTTKIKVCLELQPGEMVDNLVEVCREYAPYNTHLEL